MFFPNHRLLSHIVETMESGERNELCRSDYHQSAERIFAELGIEPVTSCSQVLYATDWSSNGARRPIGKRILKRL